MRNAVESKGSVKFSQLKTLARKRRLQLFVGETKGVFSKYLGIF